MKENKTESLMMQAAIHAKDEFVNPVVKGLGVRLHKATILNEKDCTKVKQKEWLDKKEWAEIHDILRVQGYNWLARGKDSCWIKVTRP
jgi:G3E family GTPase